MLTPMVIEVPTVSLRLAIAEGLIASFAPIIRPKIVGALVRGVPLTVTLNTP